MTRYNHTSISAGIKKTAVNPKAAVPILLFVFVFSLVIDNGFKTMTMPIAQALEISDKTTSLQASLAGVIIGIGAVVYAALADSISIRKLMLIGIGLIVVGSLLAFAFSSSWPMVLTGRLVQTSGLAAAETLYVIYVIKHLGEADQKTYLGFSTAAFQAGLLIGALTSGFISTYVSWTAMFLIPLILILAIPPIIKLVPEDEAVEGHLDALGLFYIAAFSSAIILFMLDFDWRFLILVGLGIACFVYHIGHSKYPVVTPEFFTDGRYVWTIVLVFFVYSTQMGFIFLLPYAAHDLHGMSIDKASLLMIPGYVCAILIGIFSGKIGGVLSSRATIYTAFALVAGALVAAALFVQLHVAVLILVIVAFASGFALMYAPLVNTALRKITATKSGIAIGFYNLTINIAIPLGIAYTAKLQDLTSYNTVLWILAAIAAIGIALYVVSDLKMARSESRLTRSGEQL